MRAAYILAMLTLSAIEVPGQTVNSATEDNTIICVVENPALFPGGIDSLNSIIKRNLVQPANCPAGRVFVAFFVGEDGRPGDFEIVRGLTKECDDSALEVMKKMPAWIPATQSGKPIRCRMVVPIRFD